MRPVDGQITTRSRRFPRYRRCLAKRRGRPFRPRNMLTSSKSTHPQSQRTLKFHSQSYLMSGQIIHGQYQHYESCSRVMLKLSSINLWHLYFVETFVKRDGKVKVDSSGIQVSLKITFVVTLLMTSWIQRANRSSSFIPTPTLIPFRFRAGSTRSLVFSDSTPPSNAIINNIEIDSSYTQSSIRFESMSNQVFWFGGRRLQRGYYG